MGYVRSLEVAVCRVNITNYKIPVPLWKDWKSIADQFSNLLVLKNVIAQTYLRKHTHISCTLHTCMVGCAIYTGEKYVSV